MGRPNHFPNQYAFLTHSNLEIAFELAKQDTTDIVIIILPTLVICSPECYMPLKPSHTPKAQHTDPTVYRHTAPDSSPTIQLTNHGIAAHPLPVRITNKISACCAFLPHWLPVHSHPTVLQSRLPPTRPCVPPRRLCRSSHPLGLTFRRWYDRGVLPWGDTALRERVWQHDGHSHE